MTNEQKAQSEKKINDLKKKYTVRGFKTTSESFKFMKKIAGAMSNLEDMENLEDEDVSKLFELFDEKLIKSVVSTYLLKKEGDKRVPINYEKEFIGDIGGLMVAFSLCVKTLMEKLNGGGKQEAQPSKGMRVKSKKR